MGTVSDIGALFGRPKHEGHSCAECVPACNGPFFNLDKNEIAGLDKSKSSSFYAKGQTLFQEDNPALGAYCIREGLVKLFKVGIQGKEQILRIAGPGELIGYRAVLAGTRYQLHAAALTDSEICYLPADAIRGMLNGMPTLAGKLMGMLTLELQEVEERLVFRSQRKMEERLILFILQCGEKLSKANTAKFSIPLSRQEIADLIGSAPETVIRGLRSLHNRRLIKIHRKKSLIEIPNKARLVSALQTSLQG